MISYVYDGTEVRKTGRVAKKELVVIPGKPPRIMTLEEIAPIDESFDWKKWVDPAHLFIIQDSQ